MDKDRLGPLGSLIGTLCFIVFGIVGYMNFKAPLNIGSLIFGALVGLLFGIITKSLLGRLLSLLNRDVVKEQGKKAVSTTVKRCTIYMFPYTVMVSLAAYFLGWAAAGVFFSAAVMSTGVVAATEVSKLKGKGTVRNNIATSLTASVISVLWMISSAYLKNVPGILDSLITMASTLLGVKQ